MTNGPVWWWRMGDPSGSTVAAEWVAGIHPLTIVGTPTFGAGSLLGGNDPDGAVQFTAVDQGLQSIFPEGTAPWTTAGSVELIFRADAADEAPVFAVAALAPTPFGLDTLDSTGVVWVEVINAAGGIVDALSSVAVDDGQPHHIVVTWAVGASVLIYIDGVDRTATTGTVTGTMTSSTAKWLAALNATDYPPYVNLVAGSVATYDEFAVYDRALTPEEIAAHHAVFADAWAGDTTGERINRILDAADWPAADRLIDDGASIVGEATLGGSALAYLQKVEETEQGHLFVTAGGELRFIARHSLAHDPYLTPQATFGDVAPDLEYADLSYVYDDSLITNQVVVTREGGVTQVVDDQASRARYLRRTKVFDGVLYVEDEEALSMAQSILGRYAEPSLRATQLRLEPSAGNEATHFPQVLGRELMDRVTVRRKPQNLGPAIDQQCYIEGITHEVTATEWRTTWNLSPAEVQHYWLAEVAGYGEAGVTTRAGW